MTVKYKVVSGKYLNDSAVDMDYVVGIETFSHAQDIQNKKYAEGFDYANVSYYGHLSLDAV